MAILAVLISLLLPSLNRARDTAKTLQCASNMRQLGMAMFIYVDENRGKYPPRQDDPAVIAANDIKTWWGRIMLQVSKVPGTVNTTYLAQRDMFWCLSAERYDSPSPASTFHYGLNPYIGDWTGEWINRTAALASQQRGGFASSLVLIGEINYNGWGPTPVRPMSYSPSQYRVPPVPPYANTNDQRASHQMTSSTAFSNYLFCDGHVDTVEKGLSAYNVATNIKYWKWW
jgi:prepilin-type processing-associated H-X9-DG protein